LFFFRSPDFLAFFAGDTATSSSSSPASSCKQCCGSESEIIRMFWQNPNLKKKFGFGYGFGFRHCCSMKIFVKNQKSNT
jgi:hypothetical protein